MLASVVCLLSVIARRLTPLSIMVRERTFIAVKPDGVQRGLIGEIIKRFEAKGFKLAGMKYIQVSRKQELSYCNPPFRTPGRVMAWYRAGSCASTSCHEHVGRQAKGGGSWLGFSYL